MKYDPIIGRYVPTKKKLIPPPPVTPRLGLVDLSDVQDIDSKLKGHTTVYFNDGTLACSCKTNITRWRSEEAGMPNQKQIRIQSDGSSLDTRITTETGETVEVRAATLWLEAGELNKADLSIIIPRIDVHTIVDEVELICPLCEHTSNHKCGRE